MGRGREAHRSPLPATLPLRGPWLRPPARGQRREGQWAAHSLAQPRGPPPPPRPPPPLAQHLPADEGAEAGERLQQRKATATLCPLTFSRTHPTCRSRGPIDGCASQAASAADVARSGAAGGCTGGRPRDARRAACAARGLLCSSPEAPPREASAWSLPVEVIKMIISTKLPCI